MTRTNYRSGAPEPVSVQVGIDDGTSIEVTGGELAPGDQVIVDRAGERGANNARRSPFPI